MLPIDVKFSTKMYEGQDTVQSVFNWVDLSLNIFIYNKQRFVNCTFEA